MSWRILALCSSPLSAVALITPQGNRNQIVVTTLPYSAEVIRGLTAEA